MAISHFRRSVGAIAAALALIGSLLVGHAQPPGTGPTHVALGLAAHEPGPPPPAPPNTAEPPNPDHAPTIEPPHRRHIDGDPAIER